MHVTKAQIIACSIAPHQANLGAVGAALLAAARKEQSK